MYVRENRRSAPIHGRCYGFFGSPTELNPVMQDFSFSSHLEYIYTWRTGKGLKPKPTDDPLMGTPVSSTSQQKSDNIFGRLAARKKYIDDMLTETSSYSSRGYISTTDKGHRFAKVDVVYNRPKGTSVWRTRSLGSVPLVGYLTWAGNNSPSTPAPELIGYNGLSTQVLPYTSFEERRYLNTAYSSSAPSAPTTVIQTVVELVRGDIPSVLSNFRRNILRAGSRRRFLTEVGSEYLNVQFGWKPLFQELANILLLLITLDHMVYGDSQYRRHRTIQGPAFHNEYPSHGGSFWGGGHLGVSPVVGLTRMSTGVQLTGLLQESQSYDFKFSARFRGIAKPSRKSNSFYEMATNLLYNLGGLDPALVWELTPWSWLMDYFVTIGDSITNAAIYSPQTGQMAQDFAYWTTRSILRQDYQVRNATPASRIEVGVVPRHGDKTIISKWREPVTPFGLGGHWNLSSSQWSILVALGLAKSKG